LQQFSREISQGKWETRGIPSLINSEIHLNSIYSILKDEIIPKLKLEEFYQIDREEVLKCFENKIGGFLKFYLNKRVWDISPKQRFMPVLRPHFGS